MSKVFVLLHKGFEEIEALTIVDYLRRAEIEVTTVAVNSKDYVEGDHGILVKADVNFDDIKPQDIDLLYIPGGMPGSEGLRDSDQVIDLVKKLHEDGKYISAMCAGPLVLNRAGVAKDSKVTSYPGVKERLDNIGEYSEDVVVQDGNIITSRGPATAVILALKLIEILKGSEVSKKIEEDILLDFIR